MFWSTVCEKTRNTCSDTKCTLIGNNIFITYPKYYVLKPQLVLLTSFIASYWTSQLELNSVSVSRFNEFGQSWLSMLYKFERKILICKVNFSTFILTLQSEKSCWLNYFESVILNKRGTIRMHFPKVYLRISWVILGFMTFDHY